MSGQWDGAGPAGRRAAPEGRIGVFHVITRLIVGGAQENTVLSCARLDPARYRSVLLTGPETGPEGDLRDDARALGVEVRLLPTLVRRVAPPHDLLAALRLYRLFQRERPTIVHTHSSKAGIIGRLAARWARIPIVVHTVHGWGFHSRMRRPLRLTYARLERLAARWSTRLVVVSDRDRQTGLACGIGSPDQYVLIRSGVELAPFRAARQHRPAVRRSLAIPDDARVLGAVTRLSPQKDPETMLRAAADVLRRAPEAHLVIVGDGPLRGRLERLSRELGVSERVRMTGIRRDVAQLMGAFDVLVLTSLWEGLPRVIPQAMAAEVPIVASAVDGVAEAIEPGVTGYLVPPGDAHRFAQSLLDVLEAPDLGRSIAARARERAPEFELDEMLRRLDCLYQGLLEVCAQSRRPGLGSLAPPAGRMGPPSPGGASG